MFTVKIPDGLEEELFTSYIETPASRTQCFEDFLKENIPGAKEIHMYPPSNVVVHSITFKSKKEALMFMLRF